MNQKLNFRIIRIIISLTITLIITCSCLYIINKNKNFLSEKENFYRIEFESINKDIEYQFFYRTSESKFNEKYSTKYNAIKSDNFKKHSVDLITSIPISSFRIDFGRFPEEIKIKNVKITGKNNSIEIEPINIVKGLNKVTTGQVNEDYVFISSNHKDPFTVISVEQYELEPLRRIKYKYDVIFIFFTLIFFIIYYFVSRVIVVFNKNNVIQIIFISIVFVIISIPVIFADNDKQDKIEKRKLAEYPKVIVDNSFNINYPKEFTNWLNDHFGFRRLALDIFNIIDRSVFNEAIENDRALMGKDGWLFYKGNNSIQNYQNIRYFSDEQLKKAKSNLENFDIWLDKQGINLYIYVAPDKHRIYPEYYPDYIKKSNNYSQLDQLKDYLEENSYIKIISSHEIIIDEKKNKLMYYKMGTHWTQYGAFLGYNHLVKEIQKDFVIVEPLEISEFKILNNSKPDVDLSNMLNLNYKDYDNDRYPSLEYIKGYDHEYIKYEGHKGRNGLISTNLNRDLDVIMFRDSFTSNMIPYICETFGNVEMIWNFKFNEYQDKIINEKPDIVIIEVVERSIPIFYLNNIYKFKEVE